MSNPILVERDGAIATVILNRPEKLNALNLDAWQRLAEAMRQLDADDLVRCIVVRGAGKAFAAGADIAAFDHERSDADQARAYGEVEEAGVMAVADCRHPTVAMIRGVCVGGGLEIASACDLRICGESSRFGVPINRLGLTMSYRELEFFVAAVGATNAREILLEGSVFDAARAREMNLVNRVVPDDDVHSEAYATAHRIAAGAPLVNRWHKKFLRRLADSAALSADELEEGFAAFQTEDFRIGYQAFLEKEKPEFKGR
jgi:enoyl-CoA hydratase/carnithine racemase